MIELLLGDQQIDKDCLRFGKSLLKERNGVFYERVG